MSKIGEYLKNRIISLSVNTTCSFFDAMESDSVIRQYFDDSNEIKKRPIKPSCIRWQPPENPVLMPFLGSLLIFYILQQDHALNMVCMGKHVDRLNLSDFVAPLH